MDKSSEEAAKDLLESHPRRSGSDDIHLSA